MRLEIRQESRNRDTDTPITTIATGRISPLGNFTGFDDSTEYFFALSPIPGQTGPGILRSLSPVSIHLPYFPQSPIPRVPCHITSPHSKTSTHHPLPEPNYNAFTSYELHAFTSGCPEVASTIAYLNTTIVNPGSPSHGQYVTKIKEIAFWRYIPPHFHFLPLPSFFSFFPLI